MDAKKMLFYSDNQMLVGAAVKLVKKCILAVWVMTLCSLVVSGYQCCRRKERGDIILLLCVPTSHRLFGVVRLETKQ
jgi:hypothetical protein